MPGDLAHDGVEQACRVHDRVRRRLRGHLRGLHGTEPSTPTYHPVIGEGDFLWTPERRGPAMYWYGWMLPSLIGAVALGWIASAVPEPWVQRVILFGCLAAVAYLVLYTLALFIYDKATVELEFLKSRSLSVVAALVVA